MYLSSRLPISDILYTKITNKLHYPKSTGYLLKTGCLFSIYFISYESPQLWMQFFNVGWSIWVFVDSPFCWPSVVSHLSSKCRLFFSSDNRYHWILVNFRRNSLLPLFGIYFCYLNVGKEIIVFISIIASLYFIISIWFTSDKLRYYLQIKHIKYLAADRGKGFLELSCYTSLIIRHRTGHVALLLLLDTRLGMLHFSYY